MGRVGVELTMSLDGFIAGPNDGPEHPLGEGGEALFTWFDAGDTDFTVPSGMGMPNITFVKDGLPSAIAQAQAVAGGKNVSINAASLAQQALEAGLLDDIHIDLVPVMLGGGVRFWDHLERGPVLLESVGVVQGTNVTHLRYRVLK